MSERAKLKRVRGLVAIVIAGLILSGVTAIPLQAELRWLVHLVGEGNSPLARWLVQVRDALLVTDEAFPFLAYGTDWLAFGHFVIALAFVGAWRDPRRNIWLFEWGMMACVLVIPYALVVGGFRGIPLFWRWVDAAFGVLAFFPLFFAHRLTRSMAA